MSLLREYPCYSVDASAMIELKDAYPEDVFRSVWRFLGGLADRERLVVCEQAASECHDEHLKGFFAAHSRMVVPFADLQDCVLQFQAEAAAHGALLTDPDSTRHQADEFVVALALAAEGRDVADLRHRPHADAVCKVVTYEKPAGPGARKAKIPDACRVYGLAWAQWPEVLRTEGYSA